MFGKEDGTEFTEFDNNICGAFIEKDLASDDEVRGFAEIAGLGLVDDEEVDFFEYFMEVVVGDGDPEIHGVGRDERLLSRELIYHLELIDRVHIGEHHDLRGGHFRRNFRGPVFQDIDRDGESIAIVHVFMIFAGPREGIAFRALETMSRNIFRSEQIQVFLGKILANDADEMHRRGEITGSNPREGRGATEEVFPFCDRSFDVIDGDRTADKD